MEVMTLKEFFEENRKVAVAFSGGVDSSYLLYAAVKYGADVRAYYVKSAFQPQFEYEDAVRMKDFIGAEMTVIEADILSCETVTDNPADRCYFCKQQIFGKICDGAEKDGYTVILDGTNASDDEGDRPGMRALKEMKVKSPLRECGLTKAEIRRLSKEAGLFTWDKPAYACLATRIPTGEKITAEKLTATEKAEGFLFTLGFTDFRVRQIGGRAKIQLKKEQFPLFEEKKNEILGYLSTLYEEVPDYAEER